MTTTFLEWFLALQSRHYLKIGANLLYVNWVFLAQICFIEKHVSFGACVKTCLKITTTVGTFFILSSPQFNLFRCRYPRYISTTFVKSVKVGKQVHTSFKWLASPNKRIYRRMFLCRKSISCTTSGVARLRAARGRP